MPRFSILVLAILLGGTFAPAAGAGETRPGDRYDEQDRLVEWLGSNGRVFTATYEFSGRLVWGPGKQLLAIEKTDGAVEAYAYDEQGRRIQTRIARPGQTPEYIDHPVAAAAPVATRPDDTSAARAMQAAHAASALSPATSSTPGTWTYVYDPRNLLAEVRFGSNIMLRLQYDYQGRLIKKIGEEGIRQYVYDGKKLLVEYDGNGNPLVTYHWGIGAGGRDRLISFTQASGTFYPVFDGLGSVVGLTDSSGNKVAEYHLDAWGNFRFPGEINAAARHFAYTGYRFMPEAGLYFAVSRFYDPQHGRFITQDTYLGKIDDVPTLHRYVYARNNPTGYIDPDGHESYRQWIGLDRPTASVELEFLKNFGYNAWNAISFGALNRQDTLVEKSEAGLITEGQYVAGTTINAVGTTAVAAATFTGAGAAARVVGGGLAPLASTGATELGVALLPQAAPTIVAGVAGGSTAGFIGSTGNAVLDIATGTRAPGQVTAGEIIVPTVAGGVLGGVFGAGAATGVRPFARPPAPPRAPPGPRDMVTITERGPVPGVGAAPPEEPYLSVYHGSINDAARIRASGLDPARTPTWATRDLAAAENAIGPHRYDVAMGRARDVGVIESRIPQSQFDRVLAPTERPYTGFNNTMTSTEIVLRHLEQVRLFNQYIVRPQPPLGPAAPPVPPPAGRTR